MSDLQHDRIAALAQELKLSALPDLYGSIAQSAAKATPNNNRYECPIRLGLKV